MFGGSFNPIHFGHLLAADEVLEALALDSVLFVPAGSPPHKPASELAPAAHRLEMTRRAVAGHPCFEVSDIEVARRGPSFTVDTLRQLAGRGELFLLLGSESFLDLLSWREPREVAALARLVVVPRHGTAFDREGPAAQKVLKELALPGFVGSGEDGSRRAPARAAGGPIVVDAVSLPLSGSELRRRARDGRSLAYRMPDTVVAYIRQHRLYEAEG